MDDVDLWSGVFGSAPTYWGWSDIEFISGDWDKPGVADVTFYDPDEPDPDNREKLGQALITVADLRHALADAVEQGVCDACTGKPLTLDYEDWDACSSDAILQVAVLGRVEMS